MATLGPPQAVSGLPATPPRVGLVASAYDPQDADERWVNGFSYSPETCSTGGIFNPCSSGAKTVGTNPSNVSFQPFGIWAEDHCSAMNISGRDYIARARRSLLGCESKKIAQEFWKGTQAQAAAWTNNRYLASPRSDVLTAGPASATDALAHLEYGLGRCGCGMRGMIHAPRNVVTVWKGLELVERNGDQLETILGTVVVGDAGYDGSGPDGQAAIDGSVWAYATDYVTVRRSGIDVYPRPMDLDATIKQSLVEAVDRSLNSIAYRVERAAAATFDGCCHLAVEVNAQMPDIAGAGS